MIYVSFDHLRVAKINIKLSRQIERERRERERGKERTYSRASLIVAPLLGGKMLINVKRISTLLTSFAVWHCPPSVIVPHCAPSLSTLFMSFQFITVPSPQMPTAAVAAVAKLQPQFVMSNVSCLLTERESAKGAGKGGGRHKARGTCWAHMFCFGLSSVGSCRIKLYLLLCPNKIP